MDVPVQEFRTKAEQTLLDLYEQSGAQMPGSASIADLRRSAIQTFAGLGLPHRRVEEWKYTDLREALDDVAPLLAGTESSPSAADIETAVGAAFMALPSYRIVLAGGAFRADLSDVEGLEKDGVEVTSLAEALQSPDDWVNASLGVTAMRDGDAVIALNTALMTAGIALRLPEGLTLQKPIHVVHLDAPSAPGTIVTRNLVVAERGASATVMESFATLGGTALRNAVTRVAVKPKAAIHHVKLQREAFETIHLNVCDATIEAGGRYNAFQISMGARMARNQLYVRFEGEGAATDISGVTLAQGKQHCDTTLVVEHNVPSCESRELFKLVLNDEARGIFQGKVAVAKDAQKTDGKQMAQALLLSETAEFDSKPELEIFADDVVCGHGATSGQIDDELLFYLRARGVPEEMARLLLIQAFVGEAFEALDDETIAEAAMAVSAEWLGAKLD